MPTTCPTDPDWGALLPLVRGGHAPLQAQLRAGLVRAIAARSLPPDLRLPSTRELAQRLGIARNTVIAVYRELAADDWLLASPRSGHRVNPAAADAPEPVGWRREARGAPLDWRKRLLARAGRANPASLMNRLYVEGLRHEGEGTGLDGRGSAGASGE